MSGIGHNSTAGDVLKDAIARIENLMTEKQALQGDISDIFAELKGQGYDVKAIRELIKMRKKDQATRKAEKDILDTYAHAIGMDLV
jgi:uncharacterized protein (UPF0335 family)